MSPAVGGAKIMLAETAKAAKPRGGLGNVTSLREATRPSCDRFRATRPFDVPRRNWLSAWPAGTEEAVGINSPRTRRKSKAVRTARNVRNARLVRPQSEPSWPTRRLKDSQTDPVFVRSWVRKLNCEFASGRTRYTPCPPSKPDRRISRVLIHA
jgi:hypothetical protein